MKTLSVDKEQLNLNYDDGWNHLVVTNNSQNKSFARSTTFFINGKYQVANNQPPSLDIFNDYECMTTSDSPLLIGNIGQDEDTYNALLGLEGCCI